MEAAAFGGVLLDLQVWCTVLCVYRGACSPFVGVGLGQLDGGRQLVKSGRFQQCRVCCRVHTTAGGLIMVIALGGRAGGGVALRANVRGGPAWWVF